MKFALTSFYFLKKDIKSLHKIQAVSTVDTNILNI